MNQPLTSQISAVSPLDGDAIDGKPRPKPRRPRKARQEPQDRSLTFFCSNPQCDHSTWAPAEQARHMAREFWSVAQALVRLAPDSPEAMKLTGGVILSDLTDDECRAASATWETLRRCNGGIDGIPVEIRLRRNEYGRRLYRGEMRPLTADEFADRRARRNAEWLSVSNEEIRALRLEYARRQAAGAPLSEHLRRASSEYGRRLKDGRIQKLTREERAARHQTRLPENLLALTGEEVRAAYLDYRRFKRQGQAVPEDTRRSAFEYLRRVKVGQIERDGPRRREIDEAGWIDAAKAYEAGSYLDAIAQSMGISNRRLRNELAQRGVRIRRPGEGVRIGLRKGLRQVR